MDEYLTGANHAFWRLEVEVPTSFDPDADPVEYGRAEVEELPLEQRVSSFAEVELALSAAAAAAEARRCLRCDYGKYCS
jgi:NADH-quinone oxidoreductase subunit F